jgi:hypothetical protein
VFAEGKDVDARFLRLLSKKAQNVFLQKEKGEKRKSIKKRNQNYKTIPTLIRLRLKVSLFADRVE